MIAEVVLAPSLAEAWLYGTLSADPALAALVGDRIYAGETEDTSYPLIVFSALGGLDTTAPGFRRVLSTLRYGVHCADRVGSILRLDAMAARVDALLHGQTYQWTSGARLLSCLREQQIVLSGAVAGVQTREIVQTYVLQVQEAAAA